MTGTVGTVRASLGKIQTVRRWYRRADRARSRLLGRPDAWVDLLALCRRMRPAAVLDLGAYVGRMTERFADELSDTPIHAFEPTPQTAVTLRQRVARLRNVTVHEIALADRAGVLPLFLNRFDATNSLLENAQGSGNPVENGVYDHVGRIEVRVTTLDDWCAAELPTGDLVIKADMQGCEGRMLAGGCRVLGEGRVAALYSEVLFAPMYEGQASFWDLHETLTMRHGLTLWQIYPLHRDPSGRPWSDALWLREDVLALMRR